MRYYQDYQSANMRQQLYDKWDEIDVCGCGDRRFCRFSTSPTFGLRKKINGFIKKSISIDLAYRV